MYNNKKKEKNLKAQETEYVCHKIKCVAKAEDKKVCSCSDEMWMNVLNAIFM